MSNCYICGSENANQPLALKDSFTAHSRCKYPQSKNLCDRCYDCIDGKYKQCWYYKEIKDKWSKLWGRNWSWLVCNDPDKSRPHFKPSDKDNLLEVTNLPTRAEIREWIMDPPEPPFTISIAVSGQKHTYPFAVESQSRELFSVLFEETLIYCELVEIKYLINTFEALMKIGFSKTEILSGDYSSNKLSVIIKEWQFNEFKGLDDVVKNYRGSDLLSLIEYVAVKP